MLFHKLALVSTLAAFVAAQDISQDDIPQQCTAICAEVVSISRRCDNENESDAAELACIYRAPNTNTLLPTCEACVRQFDNDDDDDDNNNNDNDVREVLNRCNFTTTAFNSASASSLLLSAASSFASASGTVVVVTSGTVVRTTQLPQQTGGAGAAQSAGVALGVGVMGVVLGML